MCFYNSLRDCSVHFRILLGVFDRAFRRAARPVRVPVSCYHKSTVAQNRLSVVLLHMPTNLRGPCSDSVDVCCLMSRHLIPRCCARNNGNCFIKFSDFQNQLGPSCPFNCAEGDCHPFDQDLRLEHTFKSTRNQDFISTKMSIHFFVVANIPG